MRISGDLFFRNAQAENATEQSFFTAKLWREETLLGNRLWAIEGSGSPRRYKIVSSGIIERIERARRPSSYRQPRRLNGIEVYFKIDSRRSPVEITGFEWFRSLLKQQQNFRLGFNTITSADTIQELEAAWAAPDASKGVVHDIDGIRKDLAVEATTRRALIDARLGQGRFRAELERRWHSTCAVTGCEIGSVLRASHIKPWKSSTNAERLDPANGLLLAAHIDALFDSGLISFGDDGRMLISPQVSMRERRRFELPAALRMKLSVAEKRFLEVHRTEKFKRT